MPKASTGARREERASERVGRVANGRTGEMKKGKKNIIRTLSSFSARRRRTASSDTAPPRPPLSYSARSRPRSVGCSLSLPRSLSPARSMGLSTAPLTKEGSLPALVEAHGSGVHYPWRPIRSDVRKDPRSSRRRRRSTGRAALMYNDRGDRCVPTRWKDPRLLSDDADRRGAARPR